MTLRHERPRRRAAGRLAIALLLSGAAALGQEPSKLRERDLDIKAADGIVVVDGDTDISFLTGGVKVTQGEIEIRAARAMIWTKRKKEGEKPAPGAPRPPFDELYAEGNVLFKQGATEMRAERLYFNAAENKAFVIDLKMRGFHEDFKQAFFVAAREARLRTRGVLQADGVRSTTCPYGVPHYHLEIGSAFLIGREPRDPKGPFDPFPFKGGDVELKEFYPSFGGAPLFFLPSLYLGPWLRDVPLRSFQYGRTSRFGHTLLTEWGATLKTIDAEGKPRKWGDLVGELDWREKRGGAYGIDLEYAWDRYRGYVDTYLLYDQGRDQDVGFEAKFPPLETEYRGRVRAFHRHELADAWRAELESWYFSDRSVQEEFFEREFKEDKEPETAAYLRWLGGGPAGAYLYERHRLNEFQTQNEYLPRADFQLLHQPLASAGPGTLYLSERLDAVHIRRRWDEDLDAPDARTWRLDAATELSLPFDLGVLQVSPFLENRLTIYEEDLEGQSETRLLWTAGGRLATQAHGTFPAFRWDLVGLRGLRHVVELEARYANTVDNTLPPSELFPYEEVDQLDVFEEAAFELRQRFLTKDEHGKPFEFLNATVGVEYYPDSDRDSLSADPNNVVPPFNWIPLASTTAAGEFVRRQWSNFHYDLEFQPRNIFRVRGGGEYNPETRKEEVREVGVGLAPAEGLALSAAQTFYLGVTDAYAFGVTWGLTEKWAVSAAVQYDFKADEYVSQGAVVSRDFHDFLLQVVLERDFGRDEQRFYLAFVPKFGGARLAKQFSQAGHYGAASW